MKAIIKSMRKQAGATMVEYGIMVALIAVVAIGAVALVGEEVDTTFTEVSDCLATPAECDAAPAPDPAG